MVSSVNSRGGDGSREHREDIRRRSAAEQVGVDGLCDLRRVEAGVFEDPEPVVAAAVVFSPLMLVLMLMGVLMQVSG